MALWEPGQTSNQLTLNGAKLYGGGGGLLLPAGENEIALLGKIAWRTASPWRREIPTP